MNRTQTSITGLVTLLAAGALLTGQAAADDYAELLGISVQRGSVLEGDAEGLVDEDDGVYLHTLSGFGQSFVDAHSMEMHVRFQACTVDPALLNVTVQSRLVDERGIAQIGLWNWDRGAFDRIGAYGIGPEEERQVIPGVPPHPYLNDQGDMVMSIKHIVVVPFFAFRFESLFNLVEIELVEPHMEFDFSIPMDGRDHVLVDDLDRLCHKTFMIQAAPDMPAPFEILPVNERGEVVEGLGLLVEPGGGYSYGCAWAIAYIARMPEAGDFANGQMQNVRRRSERDQQADVACNSDWVTVLRNNVVSGSKGEYKIYVWGESDVDGDGVYTPSDCRLEIREAVVDGDGNLATDADGNVIHEEFHSVSRGNNLTSAVYNGFTQEMADAGYWVLMQVRCNGDADEICRRSWAIKKNGG